MEAAGAAPWVSATLSTESPVASGVDGTSPARGVRPAVYRGRPIADYSEAQLRAIVRWIESDTLLRTRDQLVDEVMHELSFRRHGQRIVAAITQAIEAEKRAY